MAQQAGLAHRCGSGCSGVLCAVHPAANRWARDGGVLKLQPKLAICSAAPGGGTPFVLRHEDPAHVTVTVTELLVWTMPAVTQDLSRVHPDAGCPARLTLALAGVDLHSVAAVVHHAHHVPALGSMQGRIVDSAGWHRQNKAGGIAGTSTESTATRAPSPRCKRSSAPGECVGLRVHAAVPGAADDLRAGQQLGCRGRGRTQWRCRSDVS